MSFKCMTMGADPVVVHFIGAMTEDADLSMVRVRPSVALELELSQLTSINSIGIREMKNWTASLTNEVITVTFAPKCFIDQVNMVPDLIPRRAKIVSFYVPHYAEDSGEESRVLFTLGNEYKLDQGLEMTMPTVTDSAGHPMEPDVIPESYFAFLNKR